MCSHESYRQVDVVNQRPDFSTECRPNAYRMPVELTSSLTGKGSLGRVDSTYHGTCYQILMKYRDNSVTISPIWVTTMQETLTIDVYGSIFGCNTIELDHRPGLWRRRSKSKAANGLLASIKNQRKFCYLN